MVDMGLVIFSWEALSLVSAIALGFMYRPPSLLKTLYAKRLREPFADLLILWSCSCAVVMPNPARALCPCRHPNALQCFAIRRFVNGE